MLLCGCGWTGLNLKPNWKHDTAHCPECSATFKGINAEGAQVVTEADEEDSVKDNRTLIAMCRLLKGESQL